MTDTVIAPQSRGERREKAIYKILCDLYVLCASAVIRLAEYFNKDRIYYRKRNSGDWTLIRR
jgi:hypothetical protein